MPFSNVIKPTHLCNISCSYCYNDDVRQPVMALDTLERTISQTFIYAQKIPEAGPIDFIWHGGEPMVAGFDFFNHAIEFQKKHSQGRNYRNIIQTNGLLINRKWIDFFKANKFSISISIDGTKELHDKHRVTNSGKGTYDKVMEAIDLCIEQGIPPGACVVINKQNKNHVKEIYKLLHGKKIGFNIIPVCSSGAARDSYDDLGLAADEYADAWIPLYDIWFDAKEDEFTYIDDFVSKTKSIMYGKEADCISMSSCSHTNISTDPVGDVFACATLSGHDNTRYGNIVSNSLENLMKSPVALEYRLRNVDPECSKCKWQHVCHGGCPARSYKFFDDHHQRDFYCPSLYKIYEHVEKRLAEKGVAAASPHPEHMTDGMPSVVEDAKRAAQDRIAVRLI